MSWQNISRSIGGEIVAGKIMLTQVQPACLDTYYEIRHAVTTVAFTQAHHCLLRRNI